MEKASGSPGAISATKDAATETMSPYGTRSRNRAGASRPNYAETTEHDDLDMYDRKDDGPKKASRQAAALANASQTGPRHGNASSSSTSRKLIITDHNSKQTAPSNGAKEQHPQLASSSSPSANNSATAPAGSAAASSATGNSTTAHGIASFKKRKAVSQSQAVSAASAGSISSHGGGSNFKTGQSHSATAVAATTNAAQAGIQARQRASSQSENGGGPRGRSGGYAESNMLTFESCQAKTQNGKLLADDGTVLEANDHVYLVCEPPGEPYYLARIMEWLHPQNDNSRPVTSLRVNWYYRPKDVGRRAQDSRQVLATMHSDICPLSSLRGKCQIKHKAEVGNFAAYKQQPDSFWFEKLYDRYIQKNYEVIPTSQIVNVPPPVKKVLDERWKFILVEQGRGKEFTSAAKQCKRCSGFCANTDSVDCAVCQNTYHMNCVRPPLLKKPSRGFAWSCAACSRAQERKLEARNTPNLLEPSHEADEEEFLDEDDEDHPNGAETERTSLSGEEEPHTATPEQIYNASLWPFRYLGMHCKVEDALDYDDRIFPRASTRLGPRHQANVLPWPGQSVIYEKPLEVKKSGRKETKLSKEAQQALEVEKLRRENRPKWIQDEPPGYIERGGDDTVETLWLPPDNSEVKLPTGALESYMIKVRTMAPSVDMPVWATDVLDAGMKFLCDNDHDVDKALGEFPTLKRSDHFNEPNLSAAEVKKFEEAVSKYGSELLNITRQVKTVPYGAIVRFYYVWKKSERGKQIWGNYTGRKGKKDARKAEAEAMKIADDVADDQDDSAFDADKAAHKKRAFICKFCGTKHSRQWRRAPAVSSGRLMGENGAKLSQKDKNGQLIRALCRRCAELWRRYAVQWEDVDEYIKKAQNAGKSWRKRVDEDLMYEITTANERMSNTRLNTPDLALTPGSGVGAQSIGMQEPPRKKLKSGPGPERETDRGTPDSGSGAASAAGGSGSAMANKKRDRTTATTALEKERDKGITAEKMTVDKAPGQAASPGPLPAGPVMPKPKVLPCAVCYQLEPQGDDQLLACKECRLSVHRSCYGVLDNRAPGKWTCDMCLNDKNPQVSIEYRCVLCPIDYTEHDFVEPPKISHKKKTEKERERERAERELAQKAAAHYRQRQVDMRRPVNPREPLKRTADNNWVHVTCAAWMPETRFGSAKAFGPVEGIPLIPRARYEESCKLCKQAKRWPTVPCHQCRAPVHVECAHKAGYLLGFDMTPVKGSRREQANTIVSIKGSTGAMTAAVWCKEHVPLKTLVHAMNEVVDDNGTTALQLFVQKLKQADLTLTGCARKANQITLAGKTTAPVNSGTGTGTGTGGTAGGTPAASTRRVSAANSHTGMAGGDDHAGSGMRSRSPSPPAEESVCLTCGVDISPKWYAIDDGQERELINGYYGHLGAEAQKFVNQRKVQCHKCKKTGRRPPKHMTDTLSPPGPATPAGSHLAPPVLPPAPSAGALLPAHPMQVPQAQAQTHTHTATHTQPPPPLGGGLVSPTQVARHRLLGPADPSRQPAVLPSSSPYNGWSPGGMPPAQALIRPLSQPVAPGMGLQPPASSGGGGGPVQQPAVIHSLPPSGQVNLGNGPAVTPPTLAPPTFGPAGLLPVAPPNLAQSQPAGSLPAAAPSPATSHHAYPALPPRPQSQPPQPVPYDWHHRSPPATHPLPSSHHGHGSREVNGAPSRPPNSIPPPLAPPSHLRPPSLPAVSPQNSHAVPHSYVNGVPQSPRRHSGPSQSSLTNGVPYGPTSPYHGSHPDHLSMSGMPPVVPPTHHIPHSPHEPQHTQPSPSNYIRQPWAHAPPHHSSPPVTRDSLPTSREPSSSHSAPLPPTAGREGRGGASTSPSLRNLLE